MAPGEFFALLLLMTIAAYFAGVTRAIRVGNVAGGTNHLGSLPLYHGILTAMWCGLPAMLSGMTWLLTRESIITHWFSGSLLDWQRQLPAAELEMLLNAIKNSASGHAGQDLPADIVQAGITYRDLATDANTAVFSGLLLLAASGFLFSIVRIRLSAPARLGVEAVGRIFLLSCALIAILTTVGIILSVLFESIRFFQIIPVTDFLFGLEWSPQIAMRSDQAGSSGAFGAVPLFTGTLLISLIAMLIAVPAGLMSAIYLSEYASFTIRRLMKPLLELLAGIPTVVYGFFAALTVAPLVRDFGMNAGFSVSSESALVAGLVMGVMIIPFISSLSDDVINAVPQAMRDGSYALGATQAETIIKVIIPAALPGIVGGVLLAVSRAIGETMIVVMAAGLSAKLTANPFESVTTVTAQIATLLVGDQEFDSAKTLAAFALGLVLFVVTLLFNVLALHIVKKYREQYE